MESTWWILPNSHTKSPDQRYGVLPLRVLALWRYSHKSSLLSYTIYGNKGIKGVNTIAIHSGFAIKDGESSHFCRNASFSNGLAL